MKRRFVFFTALVIAFRAAAVFAQDPALAQAAVYRIRMTIADDLEEIAGSLDVEHTNSGRDPLGLVVFFLFPNLTPGSLDIREARAAGRKVQTEHRQNRSTLIVPLPSPLARGMEPSPAGYEIAAPGTVTRRKAQGKRRDRGQLLGKRCGGFLEARDLDRPFCAGLPRSARVGVHVEGGRRHRVRPGSCACTRVFSVDDGRQRGRELRAQLMEGT